MVMGERIKPGTQAVGNVDKTTVDKTAVDKTAVDKTAGETVRDHRPVPTLGPVRSTDDVEPADEGAGDGAGDILGP